MGYGANWMHVGYRAVGAKPSKRAMSPCLAAALFAICLATALLCAPGFAYAAVGNTVATAEQASFGIEYQGGWNKDTDHLNCYSKITVPKRGTVTVTASKPFDSEGEYGRMYFDVCDMDGNLVWWNQASTPQMKNGSPNYKYRFNLEQGEYMVNMTPGFKVISGQIKFRFSYDFAANEYAITEPNQDTSHPMLLTYGHVYSGYFGEGNNYSGHPDNIECMKFVAPSTGKYNIKIGNYDALDATTWIGKLAISGQDETSISSTYGFDKIDGDGFRYKTVSLKRGQAVFIRYYNYSHDAVPYQVAITRVPPVDISKASSSLKAATLTYTGKALKPKVSVSYRGTTLKNGVDYTVAYKNNAEIGKGSVTVTGIGDYTGSVKKTFKIIPPTPVIKGYTWKADKVTVKWKKLPAKAKVTGFEVKAEVTTTHKKAKGSFKGAKRNSAKLKLKGSKSKAQVWVYVRAYKAVNGKKYYSKWDAF